MTKYKLNLIFLLVLWVLLNIPAASNRPFLSSGEPREALSTQYIFNTGNWLIAKRYGEELQTKPPLSHWVSAVFSLPFGQVSEFSSRSSSLIFSLVALLMFYFFVKKYLDSDIAFLSSLILLLSPEWLRSSQTARVDMTLAGSELIAMLAMFEFYKSKFKSKKLFILISLFLTLSFLTKGPVGAILPLTVFGIFLLIKKVRVKEVFILILKLFITSSVLPLLWYIKAYFMFGNEFVEIIILENFKRLSSTMDIVSSGKDPHEHSALYLYGTLILGFLPFSLYFLSFVRQLKSINNFKRLILSNDVYLFFIVATLFNIIFFSIPSSKRSVYLLPIYPYCAVFIALFFLKNANLKFHKIVDYLLLTLIICFCSLVFLFLKIDFANLNDIFRFSERKLLEANFYQEILTTTFTNQLFPIVFLIAIFIAIIQILFNNRFNKNLRLVLLSLYCILIVTINSFLMPNLAIHLSPKGYAKNIDSIINNEEVFTYKFRDYSLNFYLNGKLKELREISAIEPPSYLIVKDSEIDDKVKSLIDSQKLVRKFNDYISFKWPSKNYILFQVQEN